jgi:hypothetical protein
MTRGKVYGHRTVGVLRGRSETPPPIKATLPSPRLPQTSTRLGPLTYPYDRQTGPEPPALRARCPLQGRQELIPMRQNEAHDR